MKWIAEPGAFKVMIGELEKEFEFKKKKKKKGTSKV